MLLYIRLNAVYYEKHQVMLCSVHSTCCCKHKAAGPKQRVMALFLAHCLDGPICPTLAACSHLKDCVTLDKKLLGTVDQACQ